MSFFNKQGCQDNTTFGKHLKRLRILLFSVLGISFAGGGCAFQGSAGQATLLHETTIEVSPDGQYLIFTGQGRGVADIFTLELSTGKVTQLTDTDEEEIHPKFSPDGRSIVFSRGKPGFRPDGYLPERHIYLMDLQTRQVRQVTHDADRYDYWPALSSDGRFITLDGAVPRNGSKNVYSGDVYLTEVASGRTTQLTDEAYNMMIRPVFWQNDSAVLYTAYKTANDSEGNYLVSLPLKSAKTVKAPSTPIALTPTVLTPKGANYYAGRPMGNDRLVLIADPGRQWIWRLTLREADGSFTYLDESANSLMSPTFDSVNQRIYYLEGMANVYCYDLKTRTKKKITDAGLFEKPLAYKLR